MSKGIKIDCASFLKVLGWVWSGGRGRDLSLRIKGVEKRVLSNF